MASSTNCFPFLVFAAFFALTQARNTQFFNKVPATDSILDPPNYTQQHPDFLPDNGSGYGLYRHVSGQESEPEQEHAHLPPPSTAANTEPFTNTYQSLETLNPDFLPKNNNPVAYLTQPEDSTAKTFTPKPDGNYYPNGDLNGFNRQAVGFAGDEYYNTGGENGGFGQQGMSDTRFLENGKYFYNVGTDRYSSNHPYQRLGARNENNNRDYYRYGNGGKEFEFGRENSMWKNQGKEKFQGEDVIGDIP